MIVNILLVMGKAKQTIKHLLLITFIFLLGCATTTNTGLTLLPESKEIEIGKSYTSGEKLPPYLRLPEKTIAYSVAIKVGK
jgi:hypothetical protein